MPLVLGADEVGDCWEGEDGDAADTEQRRQRGNRATAARTTQRQADKTANRAGGGRRCARQERLAVGRWVRHLGSGPSVRWRHRKRCERSNDSWTIQVTSGTQSLPTLKFRPKRAQTKAFPPTRDRHHVSAMISGRSIARRWPDPPGLAPWLGRTSGARRGGRLR